MIYFDRSLLLLYLQLIICAHTSEFDILNQKLSDEERNERDCNQQSGGCPNKKSSEPTNFEVRALLVKCPKPGICCQEKENVTKRNTMQAGRSRKCANDECGSGGIGEEKPTKLPNEVRNCDKKLKLTVKIKNSGVTNCKNQYIIIDHVFDPLSEKKQKLANPYVLKIRQQPILQTYGLLCGGLVNYEATEKVMNNEDEGYTGCNTDPGSNPTCGAVKYNDEVVPFSTGFCCSCKDGTNPKETETGGNLSESETTEPSTGPEEQVQTEAPLYNEEPFAFNQHGGGGNGRFKGNRVINRRNPMVANSVHRRSSQRAIDQRLMPFGGKLGYKQKRGGQDCTDTSTPPNCDPQSYHESTHCLEFSDLWYTIYQLTEPKIFHVLQIQIYEKVQDQEGNFRWRDLTRTAPIVLGTHHQHYSNEMNTMTANYVAKDVSPHMFSLNYKIKKLLVPDITKNIDVGQFSSLQGGPPEYLVVDENKVEPNGKRCDVAGVGYEAFAKQPQRCNVPKGTCLKNQPKDLYQQDHDADISGKKGNYFLKYYGLLPDNPIVVNETSQNKTLVMYYTQCHTSVIDLEVRADSNQVMRSNSLAVLTEVLIDSSNPSQTCIMVKVFNSGFVASIFHVQLTDCPMTLPATFSNIASKPALIPPQQQHSFSLEIHLPLPIPTFFCTMEVLNAKQELITVRKIRLQKQDRCICIWHCLCACLIADKGLKCKPLSLEHYHAAGFQGGLPIPLHVVHYTFLDDMISLMLYILLFLCLTLLFIGLIKAVVGVFLVPIGLWGLDLILGLPKQMNAYYESSIKHRKVVYDNQGWPVHPDTGERVRNIYLPAEFCMNVVFFFIYPFAIFWCIVKKLCFSSYQDCKQEGVGDVCVCPDRKSRKDDSDKQNSTKKKKSTTGDDNYNKSAKKKKSTVRDDPSSISVSKDDLLSQISLPRDVPTKTTIKDDRSRKDDKNKSG